MYEVMLEMTAEKNLESVKEAFKRETDMTAEEYGIETFEDIERLEREGWFVFEDGKLKVFAEVCGK